MIEIPESYNLAKQLNEMIKGKIIHNVYANQSPHKFAWFNGDPADYHLILSEKTIDEAVNYAGMVEIKAQNTNIVLSDGVNFRYCCEGDKIPKKHQLHIEFDDYSSLVCSVQMYGGIWAFVDGNYDNDYYLGSKQKPSPLSNDFDEEYFINLIDDKIISKSIKAFLATQQRIPGLGNGVLQDILFNAKINPKRKLNTLGDEELENVYNSIKSTLMQMTIQGGRDTEKVLFRVKCGYKTILSRNTYKDPCIVCGSELLKQAYLGGSVYYCSECQSEI